MITFRPIRPDDAPRLVEFHQALSPRSVYRRFLFVHPVLSPTELERFTSVDGLDRVALIAEDGDRLIAVARYDRSPGSDEAEVAFVVADAFQHHGIATLLLVALADAALRHGITTFVATVLPENAPMLTLFRHCGFSVTTTLGEGVVDVRLGLTEAPAPSPERHPPADLGPAPGPGPDGEAAPQGQSPALHVA
jgi:RimJ/RimL family protein N-acetyltransferase